MKLKSWLNLSYILLALLVVSVSIVGFYFLEKITLASDRILKDNYESLTYLDNMIGAAEKMDKYVVSGYYINKNLSTDSSGLAIYEKIFRDNLNKEENNITEAGEKELVGKLRSEFDDYINLIQNFTTESPAEYYPDLISPKYYSINNLCRDILDLNKNALVRKNNEAITISKELEMYMLIITLLAVVTALLILFKIPGIVIKPIIELTQNVIEISEKNYSRKLDLKMDNELGNLADKINLMSGKLEEYERSNIEKFIAEKKRAEAIVKSMRDGIIVIDESNRVVLINSVSEELFGVTEDNITGKDINEISKYNKLMENFSKELSENNEVTADSDIKKNYFRIFYKNKEEFFLKEVIKVYDEKRTSVLGAVLILKNVTGFKELDEIKSGFIATVSHELRTPLTAMSMSFHLLQDKRIGELNEEQSKLIDTMKQEVKRLLKIVSELLNLSHIESGNQQMKYRTVPVEDIFDAAVTPMLMQIENKKIDFTVNVEKDIPLIKADVNKIAWVLINLLSNAVRYTPEGGSIKLSAVKKNNEVLISVRDSGKGIEPNNLNKIFEKFVQIDEKNIESSKSGVGLGLAISKEFVNIHGGKIWAESEVRKGTVFYFTLPFNV